MLKAGKARIWARLVRKYRLVLYDYESLSQSRHVLIKPLGVIILFAGLFAAVIAGTAVLIFKVPIIHQQIPGFQSHLSEEYKSLQRKNIELEREVAEMDSMIKVFSAVMGAGTNKATNNKVWEGAMAEPATYSSSESQKGFSAQKSETSQTPGGNTADRIPMAEITPVKRGPEVLHLMPPIDGYITMDFNTQEKSHFGIDLVADENSLIRSVADGVVIFSEYSNTTGYVIGVWHGKSNLVSFYKHNSRLFKTVGSYVFAGEAIAVIGNTGINSSGTHLHFELWYDNNPVNPADYIIFN